MKTHCVLPPAINAGSSVVSGSSSDIHLFRVSMLHKRRVHTIPIDASDFAPALKPVSSRPTQLNRYYGFVQAWYPAEPAYGDRPS